MGSYALSAEYYDLLYGGNKDYEAEAGRLAAILGASPGTVRRVLDVGCGTGRHAAALARAGFEVDGLDSEPAFVRLAGQRHPAGRFAVGDMSAFEVSEPYDAALCLFGSIGYALDEARLRTTIGCLAGAVRHGGLVVIEPWFEPGRLEDGHVTVASATGEQLVVSRVSRVVLSGDVSRLEFEYVVGRPNGITRFSEVHELGLFPRSLMEDACRQAGLRVTYDPQGLIGRGLYLAARE